MITDCNGLIFRADVNAYVNSKGTYVCQEKMILLKRKSCLTCETCISLEELLSEGVAEGRLPIINNIKHERLYSLHVVNKTTDWETGWVDDYDLEFKLCEGE